MYLALQASLKAYLSIQRKAIHSAVYDLPESETNFLNDVSHIFTGPPFPLPNC